MRFQGYLQLFTAFMLQLVLADNLAALLNRAVPMAPDSPEGVSRQVNRAAASKLFSRCIGAMLLVAGGIAQGVHDWVLTLSRCWTRHIPGRCRPRNPRTCAIPCSRSPRPLCAPPTR